MKPTQSKLLIALATLAVLILSLPIFALFTRIELDQFFSSITSQPAQDALKVSLTTSVVAAFFCALLGIPVAWLLNQTKSKFSNSLRAVILSPLVMPPTVAGIALLALLGRNGLIGQPLFATTGINLAFTPIAVIIAGIFVGLPFTVLLAESAFSAISKEQLLAAQTDGATPWQLFRQVALPQARTGLINATLMAWARAFGEFGATLMFAGSIPALTRTLPMQVYTGLETNPQIAYSISTLMIAIAITVTLTMRRQLAQALHN